MTQNVYNAYRNALGQNKRAVRYISKEEVRSIYIKRYWNQVNGDQLPLGVDLAVYDFAVNSGTRRAARLLQGLVGVKRDGQIGTATLSAVRKADPIKLASRICDARMRFLKRLSTWSTFGKGWSNRVREVRAQAIEWAREGKAVPAPVAVGVGVGLGWVGLLARVPMAEIAIVASVLVVVLLAYRYRNRLKSVAENFFTKLATKILAERDMLWPEFS